MHGHLLLLLLLLHEHLFIHVTAHTRLRLLAVILHLLLVVVGLFIGLLDYTELLLAHLEVDILALLDLAVDTVDLKFVGVHLCLVVLELCYHLFKLLSAFFQVDLILIEFFGDVRATLLGKDIL